MQRMLPPGPFGQAQLAQARGELHAAASLYHAAVKAEPGNGIVLAKAGAFSAMVKDYESAVHFLGRSVKSPWGAQHADTWHTLGVALANTGNLGAAAEAYAQCLTLSQDHITARSGDGVLAAQAGDLALAEAQFTRAFATKPTSHDDRHIQANLAALLGDYEKAWPLFEHRRFLPHIWGYGHTEPKLWTGEATKGRPLLVVGEGGLGDEIMLGRFLHALDRQCGNLHLLVKPQNLSYFDQFDFLAGVYSREEVWPEGWAQVRMFSLPLRLDMLRPKDWPNALAALPPETLPWSRRTDGPPRIGFCWRGSAAHENDYDRSYPSQEQFAGPLAEAFGTDTLVPLTVEDADYAGGHDWPATTQVLRTLDAVISVDTAIVHMAASLGVPTVLVSASAPEWRWGLHGENPWYPRTVTVIPRPDLYAYEAQMQEAVRSLRDRIEPQSVG